MRGNLKHYQSYYTKRESKYDNDGNQIFYSDDLITWTKKFNDKNELIYYSDSKDQMKEWDDDGNLIHFKDGDFEYTSEFDKSNNEIKRLYADSAVSTFEYNENNKLIHESFRGDWGSDEFYEYNENSDVVHYTCYDYDDLRCYRYRTQSYHYYLEGNSFHEEGWW